VDKGGEVSDALRETEEKTGISFDELTARHKEVRKYVETIEPKKVGMLAKTASVAKEGFGKVAGGVGLSLAGGLLGPFAGLGMAGAGAIGGIYGGIKKLGGRKREERALETQEALLGPGKMPGGMDTSGGRGMPGGTDTSGGRGMPQAQLPESEKLRGQALAQASAPLFYFFDRLAYKASWTAQVLDLLKKRSVSKEGIPTEFGAGIVGGMMAKFLKGAGIVGGIVAIVALGVAANKLTKKLREAHSKITTAMDIFRNFIPGMSLIDPIKGVSNVSEMYSRMGRQVISKAKPVLSRAVGGVRESFSTMVGGKSSEVSISNPVLPTGDKEMLKESLKTKEIERKTIEVREKTNQRTNTVLDKMFDVLRELNKNMLLQTKELKPNERGFFAPDTTDVSYENRNSVLDGLNAGRSRF
jgi:hypothetical protein